MVITRNQESVRNGSQLTPEPSPTGAEVEVRIRSEGFHDSWYEAMVLRHFRVTSHVKYQVQYLSRLDESGGMLVEDVFAKDVRPRAPRGFSTDSDSPSSLPNKKNLRPAVDCMPGTNLYMPDTHVEVFHRGSWCPGIVSSGLSGSNYAVTVKYQGELMKIQFHVSNMRLRLEWDGRRWSKWHSPSKGKKRKSVNSDEIVASDVSLTESETTADSITSLGMKVKKESLESDDEVSITKPLMVKAESCKSNSSQVKHAVRKVSRSHELLTELKDCHFKISTGKRSISSKRNLNGCTTDKKQDKVDNNGVADSGKQKDVNLSNESSSDVPQPNKNASNTNRTADFSENAVRVSNVKTMGNIADSEGQDSLPDGVANSEFNQHTLAEHSPVKSVTPEIGCPFEKASPIWKSLETTYDVFSHIPQRPHFKMLESECKETREGTAIGMMVNYANLAESTHRLSIHTEVTVFEEKIACLKSLEMNGFFVDPILSRLHHLFEIKTNLAESALKRVKLETELAKEKQELEDSHASANVCKDKMTDISKSIAELKEQLSIMEKQIKAVMEERAGILDSAAKREHDVSRIEVDISSISRSYELAFEEFGRVVAEPL